MWWERLTCTLLAPLTCTWLLIIVAMLHSISPWIIYFRVGTLYFLTPFTHFSHPASDNHQSVLYISIFVVYFLDPTQREIIRYLSFSVWLISLSIMPSRSMPSMFSQITRFPFLWLNNIPLYTHTHTHTHRHTHSTISLSIHPLMDT